MHARAHNCQLRETARCQRRILDGRLVDHVAVGGIDLIHQRHRSHLNRSGDGANF